MIPGSGCRDQSWWGFGDPPYCWGSDLGGLHAWPLSSHCSPSSALFALDKERAPARGCWALLRVGATEFIGTRRCLPARIYAWAWFLPFHVPLGWNRGEQEALLGVLIFVYPESLVCLAARSYMSGDTLAALRSAAFIPWAVTAQHCTWWPCDTGHCGLFWRHSLGGGEALSQASEAKLL